jgi:hypothetical protein
VTIHTLAENFYGEEEGEGGETLCGIAAMRREDPRASGSDASFAYANRGRNFIAPISRRRFTFLAAGEV